MNSILLNLLQAAPAGFKDPNTMMFTIMMVGFIAIFYFFIVLPQNKKRKEMQNMLSSLKKGDRVVTIGGVHGKVSSVKENEIVLKVDANAEITFEKSAIARVLKPTGKESDEISKEK